MTEQLFRVPLVSVPQDFSIVLGGRRLRMVNKWNENCGWALDLYDGDTNESLVQFLPLVTGANLLEGLDYLGIPGYLLVYTDGDPDAIPTLQNLGIESNLYYLVET